MNGPYHQIKKITETIDSASILEKLIHLAKSGETGPPVCELLAKQSENDAALAMISAKLQTELSDRVISFYQMQKNDYQHALQLSKLFGFKKQDKILEEASDLAWKDSEKLIDKMESLKKMSMDMTAGMRKDLLNLYMKQIELLLKSDSILIEDEGE